MSLLNVPAGKELPEDIYVVIEIPANADPIKYEIDKDTGALFVDRFMSTAMFYPCNYGYTKLSKEYDHIKDVNDLPELLKAQIAHFFEHYKDLEKGKWVKVEGWDNAEAAKAEIIASFERAKK